MILIMFRFVSDSLLTNSFAMRGLKMNGSIKMLCNLGYS